MANRPVFIASNEKGVFFNERNIEFEWFPGMATSQKQKSVNSLHTAAKSYGIENILEVSTKSEDVLGNKLSAFNLAFPKENGKKIFIEAAFQGSKIFENGGPYTDLYEVEPIQIKKDERLENKFKIIGFNFEGDIWKNEPKTAFYDWLYINALNQNINLNSSNYEEIVNYNAFTDIEFNPKKSINCQARSCAIYVSLSKKGLLERALESKYTFLEILSEDPFYSVNTTGQGELF